MRLAIALTAALLPLSAGAAAAQDFPCAGALQELLNQHGQFLNTFTNVSMQPYMEQGDAQPHVAGWRFSGTPPMCTGATAGTILVSMWADCAVTDIYTTGNCRLPGIRWDSY
jgi:hypothetical protein